MATHPAIDATANNRIWGQSGKHSTNGDDILEIRRWMNKFGTVWVDKRRSIIYFDASGYTGGAANITGIEIKLNAFYVAKGNLSRDVDFEAVYPKCSRVGPDQAGWMDDYDSTQCDWEEYFGGGAGNWVVLGGDVQYSAVTVTAPTGTGWWSITDSGLVTHVQNFINNWNSDCVWRFKYQNEAPLLGPEETRSDYEEYIRFRSYGYTTEADRPEMTITYSTGGATGKLIQKAFKVNGILGGRLL